MGVKRLFVDYLHTRRIILYLWRYFIKHNQIYYIVKNHIFYLTALLLCLFSCVNEEGEGGSGAIEGYVYLITHPDGEYNFETDTFPAATVRVGINYGLGGQLKEDDDKRVGPKGYFKFEYLSKGDYVIFAYNEYPSGQLEAVCDTVRVKNGKLSKADTLYIHDGKMFGKSYIKGMVLADYYDGNKLVRENVGASEQRVYIQKKGIEFPFNDVRAGSDGTFIFEKLPKGEYQIYAVSEDSDRVLYVDESSIINVEITEEGTMVEMPEPIKIKLRS